jgi:hypothetical protein
MHVYVTSEGAGTDQPASLSARRTPSRVSRIQQHEHIDDYLTPELAYNWRQKPLRSFHDYSKLYENIVQYLFSN